MHAVIPEMVTERLNHSIKSTAYTSILVLQHTVGANVQRGHESKLKKVPRKCAEGTKMCIIEGTLNVLRICSKKRANAGFDPGSKTSLHKLCSYLPPIRLISQLLRWTITRADKSSFFALHYL